MTSELSKNIPKIYAFNFFRMFLIVIPIIVPFFQSLGLSMEQVFIVQALFGVSMALFEVPTAYLGDLWGRKNVMLLGTFVWGISFSFLIFADSYIDIIIYEVLIGFAASCSSGADLSILYDSLMLQDSDERETKAKSIANIQFMMLVGESVAAILASLLIVWGYQGVLYAQAIVGWIPFILTWFLVEPPIERMDKTSHTENMKEVLHHIFKSDNLLRLTFINQVLWMLSTFFAVWIIQKYWHTNDVKLTHFGYLWAILNFVAAIVGKRAHYLEEKFGTRLVLTLMSIGVVVGYYLMGTFGGVIGICSTVLFYMARGINSVIFKEAFNWRIPSKFRNTANSISSLAFRGVFFVIGPLIGYVIDHKGLDYALYGLAITYFIIFGFFMKPLISQIPKKFD
jgi:MFS family permease